MRIFEEQKKILDANLKQISLMLMRHKENFYQMKLWEGQGFVCRFSQKKERSCCKRNITFAHFARPDSVKRIYTCQECIKTKEYKGRVFKWGIVFLNFRFHFSKVAFFFSSLQQTFAAKVPFSPKTAQNCEKLSHYLVLTCQNSQYCDCFVTEDGIPEGSKWCWHCYNMDRWKYCEDCKPLKLTQRYVDDFDSCVKCHKKVFSCEECRVQLCEWNYPGWEGEEALLCRDCRNSNRMK